ncbi:MAG: DUF308 domain-containing protein, partial [Clostridia bacterium]|nr:DUF308 domain-containing protein [Clostridia bacterium]
KLSNEQTRSIIYSVVLLVIGIMLCISPAVAVDTLSIIIGVGFLAAAAILIIGSLVQDHSLVTGSALLGGILLVLGLMFIVDSAINLIGYCAVWLMIVFGAILIVDSIIRIAWRNRKDVVGFLVEFLVGAVSFTLGMCSRFVEDFVGYELLILGIIIVLYALYVLIFAFVGKKSKK